MPGIPYYRSRAGVSQDDLGRVIGVSNVEIDLVERGRRSLNVAALCLVARAIGTSPLTLVAFHPQPTHLIESLTTEYAYL